MVTRTRFFGSLLLAGALALGPVTSVWAQDDEYPPVAPTSDCVETQEDDGEGSTVFAPGDEIRVAGAAGCADPNEEGITGDLFSTPVRLFVFNAGADGSYLSEFATIPTDVEPGDHRVVVTTADNEYVQPITIVAAAGAPSGLPTTGSQIALLVLWGTLSLVLGSVLVGLTWRRWRESRVAASVGSAWTDETPALGTPGTRGALSYSPTATEWIDPPKPDEGAETPEAVVDGEIVDEARLEEIGKVPFGEIDDVRLEETAELPSLELDATEFEEPTTPAGDALSDALEAFEAEIVEPEPNGAEPEGAESNGAHPNGSEADAEPTTDPEEIAHRASVKTSEIVDRLRDDLAAWKR